MVARLVRDQEVVGSSPVTSTTKKRKSYCSFAFLFLMKQFEPTTSFPVNLLYMVNMPWLTRSATCRTTPPRRLCSDCYSVAAARLLTSPVTSTKTERKQFCFRSVLHYSLSAEPTTSFPADLLFIMTLSKNSRKSQRAKRARFLGKGGAAENSNVLP